MNRVLSALVLGLTLATTGFSGSPTAQEIIQEARRRVAVKSFSYEGLLQVTNAQGKTIEKTWQVSHLGDEKSSKTIVRFTGPPEVKGVAVLIINHPEGIADQWMWTPAVGRERKIGFQDRSASFFDTDFTFEDLEHRDMGEFNYELAGDAKIDDVPCWVIRSTPKQPKTSQYTSSKIFIRHPDYAVAQVDNYVDRDIIRTFKYRNFTNILGVVTPLFTDVYDTRRHRKTVFRLDTIKYNSAMNDADFTLDAIKKEQ